MFYQILDYYQKLCSGQTEVFKELVEQFKNETNNGKNMSNFTGLLESVIEDIIGIKKEKGTASLFSTGGTSLSNDSINSLNDFEVISFLVIHN